jgi:hypothetical protein
MPKGKGYGGKGVGKAISERKGGGGKAGCQESGKSAIGDGRQAGNPNIGLGPGRIPSGIKGDTGQVKNDVQH